jgi:hypothetical protein
LAAAPVRVGAQPPPPGVDATLDAARAVRGQSLEVSVLTFENGAILWERFGHNALVITDTLLGESRAYNWGVFDFESPDFLTRFLTGETRYWLAVWPTRAMLEEYVRLDRTARKQVLALDAVQRAALAEYVEWNALEENRYYRYDYYLDNCSTRVRDAIDRVLGGTLARAFADVPATPRTWREETARVTDGDWPPFAGIHVALGRNADRPLTRWNEGFIPMQLAAHLTTVMIADGNGGTRPLVAQDTVLYRAQRAPLPDRAPDRRVVALLLGAGLAALVLVLGRATGTTHRVPSLAARLVMTVWYGVGGVLGTALLLAGTVTKHAPYMGSNLTLLQVHPLLLVAACVTLLAGVSARVSRALGWLTALVAALSVTGLVLQLTVIDQQSWPVVAVTVPVHVACALVCRGRGARPSPASSGRAAQALAA